MPRSKPLRLRAQPWHFRTGIIPIAHDFRQDNGWIKRVVRNILAPTQRTLKGARLPNTAVWLRYSRSIFPPPKGVVHAWQKTYATESHDMSNILEVLNIQAALANAQERRIQALTDWYNVRVELASKLGWMEIDDAGVDRTHHRRHLSEESHWFQR
jgi:hypothetical protein